MAVFAGVQKHHGSVQQLRSVFGCQKLRSGYHKDHSGRHKRAEIRSFLRQMAHNTVLQETVIVTDQFKGKSMIISVEQTILEPTYSSEIISKLIYKSIT